MRTRLSWMLLACMTVVATALAPPASTASENVDAGIVRLLEDRGRSLMDRDRGLFGATLRPGSFATDQFRMFDADSTVPFSTYRIRVSTRFSADLASARVRESYRGLEVVTHHAIEETAIDGVEAEPYVEDVFLTFVRDGPDPNDPYEGWRLASDTDLDVLGGLSARYLWHGGPVEVLRSEHFLVLTHPDLAGQLRDVLPVAERAYADVDAFWPRTVDKRYVVIVPRTSEELGRMIRATVDLSKFVAFAAGSVYRDGGWEPAAVRLYIHPPNFGRYDPAGQGVTFAHELIHAVTRPVTGPFVPFWVEEGLAMIGSEPRDGLTEARRGALPQAFPTSDEFFVGPVGDIVRSYRRSQVAVDLLRERFGMEGVAAFYESLGAARQTPGTQEYHVSRAVREAVDWTVEDWQRAWLERLR